MPSDTAAGWRAWASQRLVSTAGTTRVSVKNRSLPASSGPGAIGRSARTPVADGQVFLHRGDHEDEDHGPLPETVEDLIEVPVASRGFSPTTGRGFRKRRKRPRARRAASSDGRSLARTWSVRSAPPGWWCALLAGEDEEDFRRLHRAKRRRWRGNRRRVRRGVGGGEAVWTNCRTIGAGWRISSTRSVVWRRARRDRRRGFRRGGNGRAAHRRIRTSIRPAAMKRPGQRVFHFVDVVRGDHEGARRSSVGSSSSPWMNSSRTSDRGR